MIPKLEIEEIKKYLLKSENPLFFYDDDPDGLCSYLLLKKFIGRGKGIVVKRAKELGIGFLNKIKELSPDYVFILDIPTIDQEFIDKIPVPVIVIDHHPIQKLKGVHYYNPLKKDKKDNRPVTYWCYKITGDDLWLAMLGCVADWQIPDFKNKFIKQYPDLFSKKIKDPSDAFKSKGIGDLVKIFTFLLKGPVSDVRKNVSILSQVSSPYEILNQTSTKGKFLYKKAKYNAKSFDELYDTAIKTKPQGNLFLFTYPSGKVSYTAYLSNLLINMHPDKLIIIARDHADEMKMSLRSKHIKVYPILQKILKKVGAYGGGHEYACGAGVKKENFKKFIDAIKKEVNKDG